MTLIGKYQILEQVGEGAMGVVYKAKDPVLNRTVAIKVMSEGLAQDEGLRERFLREAQAAGSLQHPNVVTIYDFGETDGHLFIAMEFIQGADLEHLLEHNAPLSLASKLDIIIDVLNGLSYAHRRGIIHRDIKPANIRIDEEGHARIMDFGVAHLATSNLTKSGVMMGTPNYMAPEQITGENLTAAVDLFSVGALLYELLTNTKPFQGDTMHSVLFKIVSESPPELRDIKPDLPAPMSDIVKKALAKNPADRFRNAAEMGNALSAVRATLGAPRLSKTLANRVSQRSSIEKSLREQREAQERAAAARRWGAIGVGGAAIVGIVTIAFFVLRREQPASPSAAPAVGVTVAGVPADTVKAPRSSIPESSSTATGQAVARPDQARGQSAPRQDRDVPRRTALASAPRPGGGRSSEARSTAADSVTRIGRVQDSARAAASAPPPALAAQSPPPQTTPVVSAPVETARVVTAPARAPVPEPENSSAAISSVIAAYGRAIGTREVTEVRRVYAGMTPQQQSQWESFFGSVRSMSATFQIASLDVSGSSATARLTGLYEYVTRAGRTERQPVSFEATLQRDGERWKLQSVR